MRPSSIALAAVLVAGCGTGRGAASQANLSPANVTAPAGVDLVMACTPSGPELCFNAIDDNCNGVIDEGCGVATGVLQFTIAWGDSPADIDLIVTDPLQQKTSDANRSTSTGFHLDHDCPGDGDACHGQNIENVYFEGMDPPRGHYTVDVKLVDLRGAEVPVKVRFGARVGGRTFGAEVALTREDDKKTFGFDL